MNEMNEEWKCGYLKCVQKPTRDRNTVIRTAAVHGTTVGAIYPVEEEKVYGGKYSLKSQVFTSEWNSERMRYDANGHTG